MPVISTPKLATVQEHFFAKGFMGFTLIEVLVVVTIITLLLFAVLLLFRRSPRKQNRRENQNNPQRGQTTQTDEVQMVRRDKMKLEIIYLICFILVVIVGMCVLAIADSSWKGVIVAIIILSVLYVLFDKRKPIKRREGLRSLIKFLIETLK